MLVREPKLGDRDRATHIIRSNLLREGVTLSEATEKLASLFNTRAKILPMSDDPVSTYVETPEGTMHFQDFWVGKHGDPEVLGVDLRGVSEASIPQKVLETFENDDLVLIGPSNPITSIGPIISLPGMKDLLKKKKVLALSPIIGNIDAAIVSIHDKTGIFGINPHGMMVGMEPGIIEDLEILPSVC